MMLSNEMNMSLEEAKEIYDKVIQFANQNSCSIEEACRLLAISYSRFLKAKMKLNELEKEEEEEELCY